MNAAVPARAALPPAGEEILLAILPVVLGALLPTEPDVRARAFAEAVTTFDDYLAHLSLPLQRQARRLFAALGFLPVRLALLGTARRWRDTPPARIESFLRRARRSRVFALRRVYEFLQSMAVIAWFDLPVAWNEIGYPGPPIERPVPGERPI